MRGGLSSNDGAAGQFAAEREIIHQLIGSPNQVETVMSPFEKRPAAFSSTGLFRSGSR